MRWIGERKVLMVSFLSDYFGPNFWELSVRTGWVEMKDGRNATEKTKRNIARTTPLKQETPVHWFAHGSPVSQLSFLVQSLPFVALYNATKPTERLSGGCLFFSLKRGQESLAVETPQPKQNQIWPNWSFNLRFGSQKPCDLAKCTTKPQQHPTQRVSPSHTLSKKSDIPSLKKS